jgi:hypothetical protein
VTAGPDGPARLPRALRESAAATDGKAMNEGTVTAQIGPRSVRAVRQANCFQSIFGSQTSLDFISFSQVTSSPV